MPAHKYDHHCYLSEAEATATAATAAAVVVVVVVFDRSTTTTRELQRSVQCSSQSFVEKSSCGQEQPENRRAAHLD